MADRGPPDDVGRLCSPSDHFPWRFAGNVDTGGVRSQRVMLMWHERAPRPDARSPTEALTDHRRGCSAKTLMTPWLTRVTPGKSRHAKMPIQLNYRLWSTTIVHETGMGWRSEEEGRETKRGGVQSG